MENEMLPLIENMEDCELLRRMQAETEAEIERTLSEIGIISNDIKVLNEKLQPLHKQRELKANEIEKAEIEVERTQKILLDCIMRGGSSRGECPNEEAIFLSAVRKLRVLQDEYKRLIDVIDMIEKEKALLLKHRNNLYGHLKELRKELVVILLAIEKHCTKE